MKLITQKIGSYIGVMLSAVGAGLSLEEIQRIVSIVCTIVGMILTIVMTLIIPLVQHIKKAKEDGVITKEEIEEGKNIISSGIENIKNSKKD